MILHTMHFSMSATTQHTMQHHRCVRLVRLVLSAPAAASLQVYLTLLLQWVAYWLLAVYLSNILPNEVSTPRLGVERIKRPRV